MQLWTGCLTDLAEFDAASVAVGNTPATIVIGEVTRLSAVIGDAAHLTRTVDAIALQQ